jgi:hypothetical protein
MESLNLLGAEMNALELADYLDKCVVGNDNDVYKQAVNMLRQQQAEIEALKNPILKAISMAFDPLTDEEIRAVWYGHPEFKDGSGVEPVPFARAVLKKAQEK